MKPIIGITLDYVNEGSFSPRPHYAIRDSYFNAVYKAGGIPIGIAYLPDLIDSFLDKINGLIIPGGDFALDSSWYLAGDKPAFEPSPRLAFDVEIITKALARKIPLLGICAGMQILGGMHGCKMTSNVMKYYNTACNHHSGTPAEKYAHKISVSAGSLLSKIIDANEMPANSRHKEGFVEISEKALLVGEAEDGVIEAIEIRGYDFALGVQWHPEFFIEEGNPNFSIFKALVNQASK